MCPSASVQVDIRKWFADHVATVSQTEFCASDPVMRVRWRKPGTSAYWIDYIFHNGALFVRGDMGEAVYVWTCQPGLTDSLGFFARMGFSYFSSKCEASDKGRRPRDWSSEEFKKGLLGFRKNLVIEGAVDLLRLFKDLKDEILSHADSAEDLRRYLQDEYESAGDLYRLLNGDAELFAEAASWGEVPELHQVAHWLGLKMAHEQIQTKGAAS